MKYIPNAVSRKAGRALLKTQKNSPQILLVAGIVGAVSATVLACRATLRVEDEVVIPAERNLGLIRDGRKPQEDVTKVYIDSAVKLTKLYGPAVVVGALSIFALTKSHSIMSKRNAGLAAAYAAIDKAFTEYRSRVVEQYGEEKDLELRHNGQEVDILTYDEKGRPTVAKEIRAGEDVSGYAKWFDSTTSANWEPDRNRNRAYLQMVEDWANSKLISRGHLFLNEVYSELGLTHTTEGAVVGWLYEAAEGDGYVDFSIFDGHKYTSHFFNGPDGAILLDFNVDGEIFRALGNK